MDKTLYQLNYRYRGMKSRCYNLNNPKYKNYGGRGIKVCDRWLESFDNFVEDMLPSFESELTLDRIDVDSNYGPSNCRWTTQEDQQNNRTNNRYLKLGNRKQTLFQWAHELDIKPRTLHQRLNGYHWSVEKALLTPVRKVG